MRKLVIFSGAFAVAAALYVWALPQMLALAFGIALLATGLLLLLLRKEAVKRIRIAALGLAAGMLWSCGYETFQIEPLRALCGENAAVTAEVSGYPERTEYGCRVETTIRGGTMLLYLDGAYEQLKPGDVITIQAEVVDVSQGSGESESLYFQSKDISLLAFQNEAPQISTSDAVPLKYYPTYLTHALRQHITKLFPEDAEGFVRALLTGDKSGADYTVQNQMSITGLSHVFSVSGMHVSLLIGFFMALFRKKRIAAVCGIAAMLLFAAMLGFAPSVTRAVIMNAILLLAPVFKRENDPATTLSFALLVILLGNPWAIASLSLQLSFFAMAGIFLFAPKIYGRICKRLKADRKDFSGKVLRVAALSIATTFGATSLTLPLIAVNFQTVSLIAPLSNLLLLNLISVIFALSFVVLLVGMIVPLGTMLAWLLSWPIRLVLLLVKGLSKVPYAAIYIGNAYMVAWLVVVYILLLTFFLRKRGRRVWYLAGAAAATLLCAIAFSALDRPDGSFTMLDVGQGQSIVLQSGDFTVMVDCGGDSGKEDGEYAARSLLISGQMQLDALILTHYDDDHTCGIEQLFDRIDVQYIFLPDISDDSGRREEVVLAAQEAGVIIHYVTEDITLEAENAVVQILMPLSDSSDNEGLCALMSLGECDILVTGDMSIESEYRLLEKYDLPDLEVLVAGHHGSKYSTSEALLQTTQPETVLISVGKNSYGHPTQVVLDRIASIGAVVYRTDLDGDITITR